MTSEERDRVECIRWFLAQESIDVPFAVKSALEEWLLEIEELLLEEEEAEYYDDLADMYDDFDDLYEGVEDDD